MTITADEELVDLVKKWDDAKRRLVLVTAGKPGVGKSTVINNLLGLEGKKAAKAKGGAESVTKSVNYYEEKVHGITVRIIDTPGFEAEDRSSEEERQQLATLSVLTEGKADLLLYCMSLAARFEKDHHCIVNKLTKAFTKKIWRHTILVLTRGDSELTDDEEDDRQLLEGFTTKFEETLKNAGVSDVPVKSILSTQDVDQDLQSGLAKPEIVGIPVGKRIKNPPGWAPLLLKEAIKRCRIDAIPAMLVLQGITPRFIAEAVRLTGGVAGAAAGGTVAALWGTPILALLGGGVGGIVGAVVGGVATGGVGVIPGAFAGATAGADFGAGVGLLGGVVGFGALGSILGGMGAKAAAEEWTGLAMIIKARQNVQELKEKKKMEELEMKTKVEKLKTEEMKVEELEKEETKMEEIETEEMKVEESQNETKVEELEKEETKMEEIETEEMKVEESQNETKVEELEKEETKMEEIETEEMKVEESQNETKVEELEKEETKMEEIETEEMKVEESQNETKVEEIETKEMKVEESQKETKVGKLETAKRKEKEVQKGKRKEEELEKMAVEELVKKIEELQRKVEELAKEK